MPSSHPPIPRAGGGAPRAALLALVALVAALAGAAPPATLAAQAPADPPPPASMAPARAAADSTTGCRRCLGGHRFLMTSLVADPFVTTHFRSGTGAGTASNLTLPIRNLQGQAIDTLNASIGFLVLDFEYQWAATRWLALRATDSAVGRSGTNAASVLASGASVLYGASLGATARAWGNERAQIGLTGDVRRNQAWVIDPLGFGQAIADDEGLAEARARLLRTVTTNRYVGGVRGAWAPRPWLGLNGLIEAGTGKDPSPGGGYEPLTEWGVMAGVDARSLWNVPIGVWTGYRGQSGAGRISDVSGSTRTFALGALYTGRPHYLVGIDASFASTDPRLQGASKIDVVQARLVSRFDF